MRCAKSDCVLSAAFGSAIDDSSLVVDTHHGDVWNFAAACLFFTGAWPGCQARRVAGFETVDVRLEQAARTLGRSEWGIFWAVTLPLAWRSVLAGIVLVF